MHIGVQGRLVRPQPVDYGVVRGLCAALCGRYACLRSVMIGHSGQGREIPALVLSAAPARRRVLMVSAVESGAWWTALYALRLCEEMCACLRANLSLCGVPLGRALYGRQVWFVPLPEPDGTGSVYHSTAGWEEKQALPQKNEEIHRLRPFSAVAEWCRRMDFCHAVELGRGAVGIGWECGDITPSHSRLMAQVLSAVSGFSTASPLDEEGFAHWFISTFHHPALTVRLGEGEPPFDGFYANLRETLLLSTLF